MKKCYKNCIILDGTENMEPYEGSIVVENGKIKEIGQVSEEFCEIIDLKGQYVVPGLINMHVHIPGSGYPKKGGSDNKKLAQMIKKNAFTRWIGKKIMEEPMLKLELMSGVTTLRAVGGVGHFDSETRNKIMAHKLLGPRMLVCDEAVTIPGGHMEGTVAIGCKTKEEYIAAIDENVKAGVDWIKLMITGGVLDATKRGEPGEMKMTREQVQWCVDRAHELHMRVCAHVESPMGVKVAVECGVDSIEHGALMDDETVELMKKTGKALVCTLSPAIPLAEFDPALTGASEVVVYNTKVLLDGIIDATKKCVKAGVTVGLGTDVGCPFVTHYDMWRELEYVHKLCGISRKQALHMATEVNATILNIQHKAGTLKAGKAADFIVVEKNPLEGFANLRQPKMVVNMGHQYDNPVIKKNEICEEYLDKYMATLA